MCYEIALDAIIKNYLKAPYVYESKTHKTGEYNDPNNKCD